MKCLHWMFKPPFYQKYWNEVSKTSTADGELFQETCRKFGRKFQNHGDDNAHCAVGSFLLLHHVYTATMKLKMELFYVDNHDILCTAEWRACHAVYGSEATYSCQDMLYLVKQVFGTEATDYQNADTVLAVLHCTQIYMSLLSLLSLLTWIWLQWHTVKRLPGDAVSITNWSTIHEKKSTDITLQCFSSFYGVHWYTIKTRKTIQCNVSRSFSWIVDQLVIDIKWQMTKTYNLHRKSVYCVQLTLNYCNNITPQIHNFRRTYNSVYLSIDCWISRRYTARSITCSGSYSDTQTLPVITHKHTDGLNWKQYVASPLHRHAQ